MKFQELVTEINNAFFRLESFMNRKVINYPYFGFNGVFTKLFIEAQKPNNITYTNCKLIGDYWKLTEQIRVDYDKSDFENSEAYSNESFCKDCEEIINLNWERIEDFEAYLTPDKIAGSERKISIIDILNTEVLTPQKALTNAKQEQPKTFQELFYNPEHAEPCLKILNELQPPVIDALNNYIGKAKGIFPLWVKVLKEHKPTPLIIHFKDTVYKDLLNQKIKGLNLTKDASEFRKDYKRLKKNKIELDIKAILSQYSQSGKLGK